VSRLGRSGGRERGQGLVEFSLIIPLVMLLILGMLEFGFVFAHSLTLGYATREGARTGAALANGGGPLGCGSGQSPNAGTVDPLIIAAVERVLTSPGSPISIDRVEEVRIFRATSSGTEVSGAVNVWVYAPGGGPTVDGRALDFRVQSTAWSACSRRNDSPPDSIGIGVRYDHRLVTPLAGAMRFFGGGGSSSITISDRTVMALNPN
jgi:hypothetical protein